MDIQVVLTENDPKLGKRGQVVRVSPGFAQNFLFPNHKAKPATAANLKEFEQEKVRHSKEEAERLSEARQLASRLSSAPLRLEVSVGEGDKLFGSVTTQDIAEALGRQGLVLERRKIHLEEPLKKIGNYLVDVKLYPEVTATLKVELVKRS